MYAETRESEFNEYESSEDSAEPEKKNKWIDRSETNEYETSEDIDRQQKISIKT